MTIKDYVYLGLILLAALAFYCNGFYAGVYRCKRMYDTLLDDSDEPITTPHQETADGKFVSEEEKVLATAHPTRDVKILFSNRELRGDFGKN